MKTKNFLTGVQAYCPPETRIIELYAKRILCASNSSADDLKLGDELLDYEQIF